MCKYEVKADMAKRLAAARSLFGILPKDADLDEARDKRLTGRIAYEEAIIESLNAPSSECIPEDEVEW